MNEQVNTFLTEAESVLNKIEFEALNLSSPSSSTVKVSEIKVPSFDEFFIQLKKKIFTTINRIYQGFSHALQTSKKNTNLEKVQHATKLTEIRNQLEDKTSSLQKNINQEKTNFNFFLQRIKNLLEQFPTKGNLTCPGSVATSGEKTSFLPIQSTEQDQAFSNLNFPEKRQIHFAKELREMIIKIAPEFQLRPPPSEENVTTSNCPLPGSSIDYVPQIHQQLIGQLFHPRLKKYKGFLVYHDLGTGKTYAGIEGLYTWYKYAIESEYKDISRDVLILAPTKTLVSNWQSNIEKFFTRKNIKFTSLHGKFNTRILEIGEKELSLFVIIECFGCPPLDGTSFAQAQQRNWKSINSQNEKDFDNKNNFSQYPEIYSSSSSDLVAPFKFKDQKKKNFVLNIFFISTKRVSYYR